MSHSRAGKWDKYGGDVENKEDWGRVRGESDSRIRGLDSWKYMKYWYDVELLA